MGEGEAEELRDELDVHQAALDELEVPQVAVAFLLGDQGAHFRHLAGDRSRVALACQRVADRLRDIGRQTRSPAMTRARVSAMCSQVSASSRW